MPTVHYSHCDITSQCHLGRDFSLFRQNPALELKVCDSCGKPIKLANQAPTKNPMLDSKVNIPTPPNSSGPKNLEG